MIPLSKIVDMLNGKTAKPDLPKSVKFGVENYRRMSIHIDAILPAYINAEGYTIKPDMRYDEDYRKVFSNSLMSKHPREKEEIRNWRYSQYRPIQQTPFINAINTINSSVFQDTGYGLTVAKTEDENFIWGKDEYGTVSFFSQFQAITKSLFTDAEGYLYVKPNVSWTEKGSGKVKPTLCFIHSKDIIIQTKDEIVWEEGDVVWCINKVGYYYFEKNEKGVYHIDSSDGYYAHMMNMLPIVKAGGYLSENDSFVSWLIQGRPFADELVSVRSSEQLVNKEASHPYFISAAQDCDGCGGTGSFSMCDTCHNLIADCSCHKAEGEFIRPVLSLCKSCSGTGRQSRNPGDWMIVPKEDMKEDLLKIISPDVSVNEHLKKTADDLYYALERALHVGSIDGTNQSGSSKAKSLETRYQFIMAICNDWFDRLIPKLLNFMLALRNGKVVNGSVIPYSPEYTLIKPTQLNIKTASDLLIEYQISSQSGIPSYIRGIQLEDYVDKHFGGDHVSVKMVRVMNDIDVFSSDTNSDIATAISASPSLSEQFQIHKQLPTALRRVVSEKGRKWFIEASSYDIYELAKGYIVIKDDAVLNLKGVVSGEEEGGGNGLYGGGNFATRSGNTPTGTGSYNEIDYIKRDNDRTA